MAAQEKKTKDVSEDLEDDGNETEQAPREKKSKLTLVIILVVVFLLVAGGGAAAYFLFFKDKTTTATVASQKKPTGQEKPQVSIFWPMEPYIVNLIDNEGERYLKVVLQLELSDQKMVEEMKTLTPKLRDTILDLLSSKTYKEMIDPLGKQRLRDEIVMRMNMNVDASKGKVTKVYFTEFIIQ
ncbi:MAG: flagellar basal body-associated FliL family protein [Deltaproteobacteria bacterium]